MKKLLLIFALFSTYSSFSHELDTLITKNNFTYRFQREELNNIVKLTNTTTRDSTSKFMNPEGSSRDFHIEVDRIVKSMRNDGPMNIQNKILNIFKEIAKDCVFQNYNHTGSIVFFIYISSNGDIADLSISIRPDLFENMGYDKIIELESRIRSEYKFLPFINRNIKKVVPIVVRIPKEKLNQK